MQLRFLSLLLATSFLSLLRIVPVMGQAPREIAAKRLSASIKIDGKLDESAWKDAPKAGNFVAIQPVAFTKETYDNRTEVYILYDNEGLYLGGYCHEKAKDSIQTELIGRDNFGSNDFVGFI